MQDAIKVAFASLLAVLVGSGFVAVGVKALLRGYFFLSRHSTVPVSQQEAPVYFYAFVTFMLFHGVLLLAAGIAFCLSRGQLRRDVVSFVDSAFLSGPSLRWSMIVWAVLAAALVGCAFIFLL